MGNRSGANLAVEVLEVSSEFGDLSAGVQRLRLGPGQMSQTGSVITRPVNDPERIPVKVALRLGGQAETKDLMPTRRHLAQNGP
jgi:hypothetical protein